MAAAPFPALLMSHPGLCHFTSHIQITAGPKAGEVLKLASNPVFFLSLGAESGRRNGWGCPRPPSSLPAGGHCFWARPSFPVVSPSLAEMRGLTDLSVSEGGGSLLYGFLEEAPYCPRRPVTMVTPKATSSVPSYCDKGTGICEWVS